MSRSIACILVAVILQFNAEQLVENQMRNAQQSMTNSTLSVDKMHDNLSRKLFDRKLDAWQFQRVDLNDMTLMKPSSNAMPRAGISRTGPFWFPASAHLQQEHKAVKQVTPAMFQRSLDVKLPNDLEEELWDFVQGRRERMWAPDRRPASQRGKRAGPGEGSQLSWAGAKSGSILETITRLQHAEYKQRVGDLMHDLPLGSAATALFGESLKSEAGIDAEVRTGLEKAMRNVKVALWGKIDGPVELAELIMGKYGKYHDVSVQRNTGQVAFNIYAPYLGQASFPYTEEQYLQKLESILALLNDLEQTWYIKEFLMSPPKPRAGLPSTPRSGTAITVRLNHSPTWDNSNDYDIVDAWYMLRGRR